VALWSGGGLFSAVTALDPTDDSGKYVIQSESICFASTNHGGALANLWIDNTNGYLGASIGQQQLKILISIL
jgi:aldose 1-epimerase